MKDALMGFALAVLLFLFFNGSLFEYIDLNKTSKIYLIEATNDSTENYYIKIGYVSLNRTPFTEKKLRVTLPKGSYNVGDTIQLARGR